MAWQVLGWTADSWARKKSAPISALKHWAELSSNEQAAAAYGLGFTQASWDKHLDDAELDALVVAPSAKDKAPSERPDSPPPSAAESTKFDLSQAAEVGRKGLPWLRAAAALLPRGSKLRAAADIISAAASVMEDVSKDGPVVVQGTEDIVYLDDSGSMKGGPLRHAQDIWSELSAKLQANPSRVLKFGSGRTVLQPRTRDGVASNAVALAWNAESGSTYMWHMILQDVLENYAPGPGCLRVFVITDGGDTDSPPPYRGMSGMDPMMKELQDRGYNIQFHIIFVSGGITQLYASVAKSFFGAEALSERDLGRYRDLALATGGGFLHVTGFESEEDRRAFLEGVEASNDRAQIEESRREYERRLAAGEATRFEWYKRLPPPS